MAIEIKRGGNFFAEPHAFAVSCEDGVQKNRYGRRYIALAETFLAGFLEGIELECGNATDKVLYTAGWEYGHLYASHLDEDLSRYYGSSCRGFSMGEFSGHLHEAASHDGWGSLRMDYTDHGHGIITAEVKSAIYSSVVKGRGVNSDPLLSGFLAGLFAYFSETRLDCLQTSAPLAVELETPTGCGGISTFVVTTMERLDGVRHIAEANKGHSEVVKALKATAAL